MAWVSSSYRMEIIYIIFSVKLEFEEDHGLSFPLTGMERLD